MKTVGAIFFAPSFLQDHTTQVRHEDLCELDDTSVVDEADIDHLLAMATASGIRSTALRQMLVIAEVCECFRISRCASAEIQAAEHAFAVAASGVISAYDREDMMKFEAAEPAKGQYRR